MIRLIYVSQTKNIDFDKIKAVLSVSYANNKEHDITGALIYGQGYFIQCLEGEEETVESLYKKIILDNRHEHVELISKEDVTERHFKDWHASSMNEKAYHMIELKYKKNGSFDPYTMRPEQIVMMLDELSQVV